MPVKLNSTGGGSVTLTTPSTASDFTLTAPAQTATLITNSSAVLDIGSGQIYKDASGNVGIGTSSPGNAKLNVQGFGSYRGDAYAIAAFSANSTLAPLNITQLNDGTIPALSAGQNSTGTWSSLGFMTSGTERMRIDPSGNVGIGTGSPSGYRLNVTGGNSYFSSLVYMPGVYNQTTASSVNMHIATDGNLFRSTSSIKYKKDVETAVHGLADLMQLRPVTYKGKYDGDTVFGGLIAEEVHAAGLTEFVQYAEDGSPDALAYGNMVSLCIKAIQEQQSQIEALQARITALEAK